MLTRVKRRGGGSRGEELFVLGSAIVSGLEWSGFGAEVPTTMDFAILF